MSNPFASPTEAPAQLVSPTAPAPSPTQENAAETPWGDLLGAPAAPAAAPTPPDGGATDERAELDRLSRLSATDAAHALAQIAAEQEGLGKREIAVQLWRAAQLLDPMSGEAAEALVRLVG